MPRYYCDYCDTYLTHDSPSVRKQHNSGYKHKANIRSYYQKFEEQQTQILIDQKIKEHLGQTVVYGQIGAAYNQHLAAFPGARPRLPIMPPPMLPIPGSAPPPHMIPGVRPPVLPIPVPGAPGYANAPMMPMQPQPGYSFAPQTSGAPPPSSTAAPPPAPGGGQPPSSSGGPPAAAQMYNFNPAGTSTPNDTPGGYSYPQSSETSH